MKSSMEKSSYFAAQQQAGKMRGSEIAQAKNQFPLPFSQIY